MTSGTIVFAVILLVCVVDIVVSDQRYVTCPSCGTMGYETHGRVTVYPATSRQDEDTYMSRTSRAYVTSQTDDKNHYNDNSDSQATNSYGAASRTTTKYRNTNVEAQSRSETRGNSGRRQEQAASLNDFGNEATSSYRATSRSTTKYRDENVEAQSRCEESRNSGSQEQVAPQNNFDSQVTSSYGATSRTTTKYRDTDVEAQSRNGDRRNSGRRQDQSASQNNIRRPATSSYRGESKTGAKFHDMDVSTNNRNEVRRVSGGRQEQDSSNGRMNSYDNELKTTTKVHSIRNFTRSHNKVVGDSGEQIGQYTTPETETATNFTDIRFLTQTGANCEAGQELDKKTNECRETLNK